MSFRPFIAAVLALAAAGCTKVAGGAMYEDASGFFSAVLCARMQGIPGCQPQGCSSRNGRNLGQDGHPHHGVTLAAPGAGRSRICHRSCPGLRWPQVHGGAGFAKW